MSARGGRLASQAPAVTGYRLFHIVGSCHYL
jgi:hypothetical protein